jgi:tetratricopeptide (TPR) repeat protein
MFGCRYTKPGDEDESFFETENRLTIFKKGGNMVKRGIVFGVMLVAVVWAQNADSLIDHAVELYETRHLERANLGQSASILEGIIENDPKNVRALYELSKVCYLLGDEAEEKDAKLKLFYRGRDYGKSAIELDDESPDAHFWYMVNVGRVGQTKGVLNSLVLVPTVREEIETVLELDPAHIGALDARAMLYYELPGLLGGNLNKSIEALNKGIALDSNYTLLYVDMAKVYMKKKDYEQARQYLNRALEITIPTYEADHVLDDKPEALELLEEIKDR